MTLRTIHWTSILLLLCATAAAAVVDFKLEDQHERAHSRAQIFNGKPVIIMAGMQRKTPDALEAWDAALRRSAPEGVKVIGLSNLEDVPFFVPKNSIRKTLVGQFPKTVVLCDWDGAVYEAMGFPDGAKLAVGVFSPTGERLGLVSGEITPQRLEKVLSWVP